MKKYLVGLLALALGLTSVAFTTVSGSKKMGDPVWYYDQIGDPDSPGSYSLEPPKGFECGGEGDLCSISVPGETEPEIDPKFPVSQFPGMYNPDYLVEP